MASFAAATVLWHWNRKAGLATYLLAGALLGCLVGIAAVRLVDLGEKKIVHKRKEA